ncbi:MAG TPA: right-handed parallel beta-helix repeat-containing protein [Chthonomonadales bacterium]|nr:right-handed parallel beta-helix repeat-containing protein [Chthonomonadales bacterium]
MRAMCTALSLLCAAGASAATPSADFFVSPRGSDSWSGRLAAPNRARTDGPFATPARAQAAVREAITASGDARRPITVLLRGGVYRLSEPWRFGPEDSGREGALVTYAAYPRERPIVSGGRRIEGWRQMPNGAWRAHLPEVQRGEWFFSQLWANGERRYRPRLPKGGYFRAEDEVPPSAAAQGRGYDRLQYAAGDVDPSWTNRSDIDVLVFQTWTMARMKIASIDAERRIVTFAEPTMSTVWFNAIRRGQRFIVENVREALSEPGEWYLDRTSGELTYLPKRGETPSRTEIVAPVLDQLLMIEGDVAGRRWVSDLVFRGIEFQHQNWNTPPVGHQFWQAEITIRGAVRAVGARRVRFERCAVRHVGGYGIDLGAASQHCAIDDCEITDVGAGGVRLGEPEGSDDPNLLASHNTVTRSLIAHGGRMHPAGIGVWIGSSPHNTISYTDIHDFYYTGISVGWSWGYGPSAAHHNTLERNRIWRIGQGVLSDMGGTYTLGLSPGSVQRYLHIHDVESYAYGGWGIYFDEGTTGMLAENNVVYRTKSAGFHQHYGRDNVVRNNVFAFAREAQLMRTRAEDHLSFTFERNIVYWSEGPLLGSNWAGDRFRIDRNLYWNTRRDPITFAGASLEEWRARGHDANSIIADPLFVAPERGDFRLRPGSPASRIGFAPIDIGRSGRPSGPGRSRIREVPRAFPPPPPPLPPQPIAEGFEPLEPGDRPRNVTLSEEEGAAAVIRVTDEQAATGRRSLKFTDAAGQRHSFSPHMWFAPGFRQVSLEAAFSLRMGAGARFYHEWRDASSPYRVGPSIVVEPDGTLRASGRELTRIPHDEWVRIEIACALTGPARGRYTVRVRFAGRTAALTFEDIPSDPNLTELQWFGFVADGTVPSVFYLDDISLKPSRG